MPPWPHDSGLHVARLSFNQSSNRNLHYGGFKHMMELKIDLEKRTVTMVLPLEEFISKGGEGKMKMIASTKGNKETSTTYEGKNVFANVNIGVFRKEKGA